MFVSTRGDDPARRPGRVLRVGRAARRTGVAGQARARRDGRRARGELRGEGVRDPDGDERALCAATVPARGLRQAALLRLRRGEQGRVRSVREHDAARRGALDRRGVPRRSRDGACVRDAGRDRRTAAARGARSRRPADHGRRRQDEVPRQGRERGREAGRAARRAARQGARVPPPAAGRAALGRRPRHRGASCGRAGSRRSRQVALLPESVLVSMLGSASGRHLHALAHNLDPRPVRTGRRRGSIGSQRALGRRPTSPTSSTRR